MFYYNDTEAKLYLNAEGMNESSPSPAILLMEGGGKETAADDYEYDVSESLDHYNWTELIPVVIVYSVVLLLGVLGNGI